MDLSQLNLISQCEDGCSLTHEQLDDVVPIEMDPQNAMQEKPHILLGDDEPCVKSPHQVIEDMKELEVISGDGTDEKFSEAASEADLIDNEPDGAAVEPHICVTGEEHNSEETQAPDHRETDPKKAGGKRKLQVQGKWKGVDPVVFFKGVAIVNI